MQATLLFFGVCFGYFLRVNISAAIVPMSKSKGDHQWDQSVKSLILSSFFWGYVLMQLPASIMAKRFGAKMVLVYANIAGSVITMLHPITVQYGGWMSLCALRICIGLCQGVLYPCVHTILSKWVPKTERGFLSTSVYSGAQFGTFLILGMSGLIFSTPQGWPALFYISGGIMLLWTILYIFLGSDTPRSAKTISELELNYIENTYEDGGHNDSVCNRELSSL